MKRNKNDLIFVEFIEQNDWEGETWSIFFYAEKIAYANLIALVSSSEQYTVRTRIKERDAKRLSKNSNGGYMARWRIMNPVSILYGNKLPSCIDFDGDDDPFYKGGIVNFLE